MSSTLCTVSSEVLSNETILNTCLDANMPVLYMLPVYCLTMQLIRIRLP